MVTPIHQYGETCDINLHERRYSVIEKHPDISKTKRNKTLAVSGNVPPQRIPLGESRLRDSVVRCWRGREGFANPHYHVSDSGSFSPTAPRGRIKSTLAD